MRIRSYVVLVRYCNGSNVTKEVEVRAASKERAVERALERLYGFGSFLLSAQMTDIGVIARRATRYEQGHTVLTPTVSVSVHEHEAE